VIASTTTEQAVVGENDVNCILCGRFTLHQRHDAIKTLRVTRPRSAIQKRQGLLNMARVSNAPDCPAQGLRLGPRRDRVAKRPDSARTTAWANVKGRHLLSGSVGRLQLRSPDFPRTAFPHPENQPLSFPLWPLETEDLSRKTGTPALAQRVLVLRKKTLNRQQRPNGVWRGHLPSGTSVRDDARYPLPP